MLNKLSKSLRGMADNIKSYMAYSGNIDDSIEIYEAKCAFYRMARRKSSEILKRMECLEREFDGLKQILKELEYGNEGEDAGGNKKPAQTD